MRILVTNDDGIRAEGLAFLVRAAMSLGEVKIVAPDRERSACGHSMTMRDPLRAKRVAWPETAHRAVPFDWPELEAYEVNGVPTDCVNVARTLAWPDGCDLILSGINNGPNLGFDVTYSGTVAAAMEGVINGIFSIAVSMALFVDDAPIHYETATAWLDQRLQWLVDLPRKPLTLLNVNVPSIDADELRGERITAMGKRVYEDRIELRDDPWGRPYYWQGGVTAMQSREPGTDVLAVSDGFVSITPVSLDWTDHAFARELDAAMSRGAVS